MIHVGFQERVVRIDNHRRMDEVYMRPRGHGDAECSARICKDLADKICEFYLH